MKIKKLFITSLAILLCLTSVSSVNAYSTANKKNKSTISMENINIQNLLTNSMIDYMGSNGAYNGTVSASESSLIMSWLGNENAYHYKVYAPRNTWLFKWSNCGLSLAMEKSLNKMCVEGYGIEVEPGKKYKISYDIQGNNFDGADLLVFYCNSNFEGLYDDSNKDQFCIIDKSSKNKHISVIVTVPNNQKYMSIRIDPYFSNPVAGDNVKISNIKVQKALN